MFVPPGYRFHPTDEELVGYYLFKKLTDRTFEGNVIPELDMLQMEPWELPGFSALNDTEWYFFSPRDKKYPKGSKSNRATPRGYWKSTGRDRPLTEELPDGCQGVKKTLVFYLGRGNLGSRTDWVMHEFRLENREDSDCRNMDSFVLCRVYNKKGNVKNLNRSRAKRVISPCEEEHQTRSLKEQKLNDEDSSPDVIKESTQLFFNQSLHESDNKVELDAKSDVCFDQDSNKSNSESSPISNLDFISPSVDRDMSLTPGLSTGTSAPNVKLTVDSAKQSVFEAFITSNDNLSADESVTSFQENDTDIQQSISRAKQEDAWEYLLPPDMKMRFNGLGVEENAKIDFLNEMICRNFNGIGYMEYLSYFSTFEEAMNMGARKSIARNPNMEASPFLLAPLARRADSPLSFVTQEAENSVDEETLISVGGDSKENEKMLDNNLIKLDSRNGSAFVKFCSVK